MMRKLVFFGNERLATGVTTTAPTLQLLVAAGYDVVTVVSNYEPSTSRSSRELEIQRVAEKHSISLLLPKKLADIQEELHALHAELGVLVAYGRIVPQAIIDLFPRGIINIHPSLLPLHRGPTPLESVILAGDTRTGVSIMQLVKGMDAGPVFAQTEVSLKGSETKQTLADQLLEVGGAMLSEILPGVLDGSIAALPQDDSRATYDSLITKNDGLIDWGKSATQLEREIRAFGQWPKSFGKIGDIDVVITKASVVHEQGISGAHEIRGRELIVYCGQDALSVEALKPAGKQEMSIQAFLAGYAKKLI